MTIYVDHQQADIALDPGASVGEAAARLSQNLEPHGRLVTGVSIDGRPVPPEELEQVFTAPVADFQNIAFQTHTRSEVAADALHAAREAFDRTAEFLPQAVDHFGRAQPAQAMQILAACVQAWQQAYTGVLQALHLIGADFEHLEGPLGPAMETIDRLRDHLVGIRDALEAGDYVTLTDLLQYEMPEVLASLVDLLDTLLADMHPPAD